MITSSFSLIRLRLGQLAAHLVVALIALVVIGGATRVMEAGLACPDWPLCYGSFLPGHQMNLQVFLEWFHRLDAFLVGIALIIQFFIAIFWKEHLPKWLPWFYAFLVVLVVFQGGLGALTVLNLLPSAVVTAHLGLGLALIALMSALTQKLLSSDGSQSPLWWKFMGLSSLFVVIFQSLLGGKMATAWASKKCLEQGQACELLVLHRSTASLAAMIIFIFVFTALFIGGWSRSQWPMLLSASGLVIAQIALGFFSVNFGLSMPLVTVFHQLFAALLVALLAALSFRSPQSSNLNLNEMGDEILLEPCNG